MKTLLLCLLPLLVSAQNAHSQGKKYSIAGHVAGTAATLTLSGSASAQTTTDASGNYSFATLRNGSYSVTPKQSGYTFSPTTVSRTISGASISGVNFTGTAVVATTYSISGNVSGSAATLTLSGTASGQTATDGSGNYSFGNLANGSYVVAPSQSGFTFSPSSSLQSVNGANVTGVNFTGAANTTHAVSLGWTLSPDPSSSISGQNVYRSTTPGSSYALLGTVSNTTTGLLDNTISSGQTYYYVVRAVESGVESPDSNEAASGVIP